ncbi:hypothetical protein [Komagataeibacter rhaeticus]|uniref:hypothetical protein n=1 Tax=Komagataeibacter rhaeticus TaxID=215221 RepID=UPI0012EB685B|nr:hypothetical protein [Komagataeibacter rhaeticus]MBL7238892.1 hypothetical protein [Komagataeibacter rhaeticus]
MVFPVNMDKGPAVCDAMRFHAAGQAGCRLFLFKKRRSSLYVMGRTDGGIAHGHGCQQGESQENNLLHHAAITFNERQY